MGKLDVGRTVFSRFNYCTGISSFENLAIMRICLCSNLSKNLQNQKSVEYDHVKIGRKIYIIKRPLNPARKNSSNRKTPFQNLSEMESNKPSLRMKQSDLPRKNITEEAVAPFEGKETSQRLRRPPSEADTLVSPAGIADSGFEEMSVLKHSLTHKGKSKPFLTEIQSLIIGKDSLSLQSYFPRTLEVMKATQLLADNYMLQDDASLPGFSDELNELRQHSNDFGVLLEEYLKTGDDTLSVMNPVVEAYWESVKPVLKNIRSPMYLQQEVVHPHLRYRGKIGCIAVYRSRPCVIDWVVASRKIKNDSKPSEFRRQLRLVAKLGAINFDPRWSHQIDTAILIISNSDGSPAEVITLNTRNAQHLWKMWLRRLQQYWKTYANERRNADEKLELHRPDCAANIEAIEKGSFCQAADKVAYRNSNISALYVRDPNDHSTRSKSAWERKDFNNNSQNVDTFPGKSVRESGPSIIQTTEQASVAHSNENKVFQGTNQCERNSCVSSEKIATETSNSNLKCDRQIHDESENTSKKLAQTPYSRMTLFSDFIRRFWKF